MMNLKTEILYYIVYITYTEIILYYILYLNDI